MRKLRWYFLQFAVSALATTACAAEDEPEWMSLVAFDDGGEGLNPELFPSEVRNGEVFAPDVLEPPDSDQPETVPRISGPPDGDISVPDGDSAAVDGDSWAGGGEVLHYAGKGTCIPGSIMQYKPRAAGAFSTFGQQYRSYQKSLESWRLTQRRIPETQMYLYAPTRGAWVYGEDWCYNPDNKTVYFTRHPARTYTIGGEPGASLASNEIIWAGYGTPSDVVGGCWDAQQSEPKVCTGDPLPAEQGCYCDSACASHGDCCSDRCICNGEC